MNNILSSTAKIAARLGRKYFSSSQNKSALPENPQRILWIRLDHIGDGVMSMTSLAALRAKFPHAQIDALVRAPFAPLLEDLQLVDHIILGDSPRFPNKSGVAGRLKALYSIHKIARKMRGNYDLAIDARGDDVARLVAFWGKMPHRLGPDCIFYEPLNAANFSFLMTHLTYLSNTPRHAVINNLANLQPLNVRETPFDWPISVGQKSTVQRLLDQLKIDAPFAVLQTRSNDRQRDWSAENFAEVADHLISQHGLKVLLCGAAMDIPYNDHIINLAKNSIEIHNVAGELRLVELPALLANARIMVSVDTGPMHLGAMVNVPIVALMLPDLALRHYPWKQPDAVVTAPGGQMKDISVDAVLNKIDAVTKNLPSRG
ncbi:MAG: glycosyltransferase family 9 protein [Abditibacteriaceae bacterium]